MILQITTDKYMPLSDTKVADIYTDDKGIAEIMTNRELRERILKRYNVTSILIGNIDNEEFNGSSKSYEEVYKTLDPMVIEPSFGCYEKLKSGGK
jgi:hypothetical protein